VFFFYIFYINYIVHMPHNFHKVECHKFRNRSEAYTVNGATGVFVTVATVLHDGGTRFNRGRLFSEKEAESLSKSSWRLFRPFDEEPSSRRSQFL